MFNTMTVCPLPIKAAGDMVCSSTVFHALGIGLMWGDGSVVFLAII